uniref:hypothetical protein n=1 Tax=Olsenella timonensis TaxID=1805478 RepID=UPI00094E2DE9|nr:hypothetical protein [Olsenella timonensis]
MIQNACVCGALVPMLLVAYAFLGRTLAPRWPRVLRVVQMLLVLLMVLVVGPEHTRVISIFAGAVLPLVLYAGDLRDRLLVAALLLTSVRTAEMTGTSAWMLLTSGASAQSIAASWANYPAHVASALFAALVMALLLWAFARQLSAVRAGLHGRVMALVGLLAVQSASLLVLGNAILRDAPAEPRLYPMASAVCLLCVLADVELLRVAGRLRVREEELARARQLGAAVDELADRARREMEAVSEVAMLRHDVRNHLQVLRSLVEGGDEDEAIEYARTLAQAWRSGEKDGGGRDA